MFEYELTIRLDGTLSLTQGGEVMWTSDNDDDFSEEFGEEIFDEDDIDEVIEYLVENDYVPPETDIGVVDECESDDPADCDESDDEGVADE